MEPLLSSLEFGMVLKGQRPTQQHPVLLIQTSVGGTSAFSTGVISKTITVRPVNDAPNVASAFAASDSNIVERDEDAGAGSAITISNFAVPVSGAQTATNAASKRSLRYIYLHRN